MEQHWKLKDLGQTILFAAIYFVIVLAATIMGGIHPLLYLRLRLFYSFFIPHLPFKETNHNEEPHPGRRDNKAKETANNRFLNLFQTTHQEKNE